MQDLKLLNKKIDYLNRFMEQLSVQTDTIQITKDKLKQKTLNKDDCLSFEKILKNKIQFNYPKQ